MKANFTVPLFYLSKGLHSDSLILSQLYSRANNNYKHKNQIPNVELELAIWMPKNLMTWLTVRTNIKALVRSNVCFVLAEFKRLT